ncbi:MAG: gliding motility-associated C-terminal domain-containing protein [Bacteroidota bacterium]
MKKLMLIGFCFLSLNSFGQIITFQDSNFKSACIALGIDTNNDGEIDQSEAQTVTLLNLANRGITNLSGIEFFTSVQSLNLSTAPQSPDPPNNITSLSFTAANSAIVSLNADDISLSSLDISELTNLIILSCNNNNIQELEVFSTDIETLLCENNNLTSLSFLPNSNLRFLNTGFNSLTSLDISTAFSLVDLRCYVNAITSLDLSNKTSLQYLDANQNNLEALDISTTSSQLKTLVVPNNNLTILNLRNGDFAINAGQPSTLIANNNPNLTCVAVESVNFANQIAASPFWTVDSTVVFSTSCNPTVSILNAPTSTSSVFNTTFQFNRDVTGFDVDDVVLTNATISNFTAINGNEYTVDITPLDICNVDITIDIPQGIAQDIANAVNLAATTVTVSTIDNVNPVAITQNISLQLDANGQATTSSLDINNGSTDNCAVASTSLDRTSFTCSDLGSNTVTLTVTDIAGNIDTAAATVTVVDNTNPTATTQDITIQLDASGNATIIAADIDDGSSDNCSIASLVLDTDTFSCADLGQNTVTLTVTDTSGNTATGTAIVTVQEDPNQQLTAIAQNITVQLDANGLATITTADVDNGSGSGCNSSPSLSLDISSFDCDDLGANTVTLTVTDGTDTETATATVTVVDTLDPSVSTQDITVQLDANGQASIVASDIDNGSVDNCAIATRSLDISTFDCSDVGSNTVTLTVTDSSGNSASATAAVTVTESIAPIALAQDITVELDTSGNVTINASDIDNGSSDNCSIASISLDTTAFSCADLGQNTVTLTVTDTSGNASTATAVVTVEENTNQQLTAITQDITVQLDANGVVSITPQDVDNGSGSGCNSTPSLSLDVSSFDCSSLGQNTVTLTATEGSVSATATAIVTVEDSLAPDILVQDITVDINPNGIASITVADVDNGTTDNCTPLSGLTLSLDNRDFSCSELGENTVTVTAIDGNGNSGTATAIVTVQDTTLPTVVTQDIQVSLDANGNASITPEQINNGSSDDCSGVDTLSLDVTTFSCPSLGNITVTLTVTDASGNSATGTATVNITAEDLDGNGIADACENQELVVSKGFSPNGDNRNDTWTIENIEDYPNARVSVFNRWGEKVYEQVGYQNDWDAVSNQISTSRRLPAGSYLYIIETNNPEVPPMRGWMYINY